MEFDYTGKVTLITGGSRGIGRQLVQAFSTMNAKVYYTYLSAERFQPVTADSGHGPQPVGIQVDAGSGTDVEAFTLEVWRQNHAIDVLINNAAFIWRADFGNTTTELWDRSLQTNLMGVVHHCTAALPYMIRQKSGNIINISTVCSDHPVRGQAAYASTKKAVDSLTQSLSIEYGAFGIRANTISPGLIVTEKPKVVSEEDIRKIPLQRAGNALDVCHAAAFLGSEAASFITGADLLVTGGSHLN
ncbi:SDR family oxidoreductase [Paenibacillus sp. FSL K6-1096]|uniref:SDR family NAD(P)-dependent oxidoreductase n=1 Tax=Paenibacillus sp. FSL K6-1096 TaxID=2921460 RepID=UPI0030EE5BB9